MGAIYDNDEEAEALCPLRDDTCLSECMLMRRTGFGEPRCSIRAIADSLCTLSADVRAASKEREA